MNISRMGRCLFLLVFLAAGLFQGRAAQPGSSQFIQNQPGAHNLPAEEQIVTTQKGLARLAPDLRALVDPAVSPQMGPAMSGSSDVPLMVSVLIQPGTDVRRFFIRSVTSRVFAGYQWVNGEIRPGHLLKLASLKGVEKVFSTNTYKAAEAPGLSDLRAHFPYINPAEARALLARGGASLLQQQLKQQAALFPRPRSAPLPSGAAPAKEPDAAAPKLAAPNLAAPNLLDIHDIRRVREDDHLRGEGVVVAVVDTGVDFAHPDLQGAQATIHGGDYDGWPFAYDTISGVKYAMDPQLVLDPNNVWSMIGETQYVGTLPVEGKTCSVSTCAASLGIGGNGGALIPVSWPNKSKSGRYFYTVHPDILLLFASSYLEIGYSGGMTPPLVIVADESTAGVYDTVYVDVNYNRVLGDSGETMKKGQPSGGVDLNDDKTWDLSAGLLAWISDGQHHPPGVATLYPEVASHAAPEAGRLLVFIGDVEGHGTSCASQISGKAVIQDPQSLGPSNPLFAGGASVGGAGGAVIQGMAPMSEIAAFQNGFNLPLDAWTLAALGMDGIAENGDEAQIVNNSWGDSSVIDDGWDAVSRFAQHLSYEVAPTVSFLVATGNGGHGYGTVTAPGGGSILDVGASTAYGALKSFEAVTPEQFLYGEVQPWSNRGPGALGDIAPDIVATGAWGTGAMPLNRYFGNGQAAYDVFGGTSMATPVTAGTMALVYQAYYEKPENRHWPAWNVARSFLLSGAKNLAYDGFVQGSGMVQAGNSVDIVAGRAPWVEPQQAQFGSPQYPAYPSLMYAGGADSKEFIIHNPTDQPVTIQIGQAYLRKFHEETFSFSFSPPAPNGKNSLPIFLKDLTGVIEQYHPALVRAQVTFPYKSFDVNGDYFADNWWRVYFYDWMDRNSNGRLWADTNRDGIVEEDEIDIDKTSGIYEYNRFTYGYPQGTGLEASLGSQAMAQKHDGVFLGLACTYCGESVALQVRVTFYEKTSWDWLALSASVADIPVGGQFGFQATLTVPPDARPGVYESSLMLSGAGREMVIPLDVLVASDSTTFSFGGNSSQVTPYENGIIFGAMNWGWRYDSGDWRFIYYNLPEGTSRPGQSMLVDTRWNVPKTDIDTWVFGSPGQQPEPPTPSIFGPQGLELTGGSNDTYLSGGKFLWDTNTGTTRELVGAPIRDGLGLISLHNVLFGGGQLVENITGSVFQFSSAPDHGEVVSLPESAQSPYLSGEQAFTFTSTGDIPEGIQVRSYGLSLPIQMHDQKIRQDVSYNICSSSWVYGKGKGGLAISNGGLLDITTTSASSSLDLDLYLYVDNGDGVWSCTRDALKTYSLNADSNEHIKIYLPEDGVYWVVVHGYSVPAINDVFNIDIRTIQGTDIRLQNLPIGPVYAGQSVQLNTNFQHLYSAATPSTLEGMLLVGPPSVPTLLEIPIFLRPAILIYPKPVWVTRSPWLHQEPQLFTLTFQNQGTQDETVDIEAVLPLGLVYQPRVPAAPDEPDYDSATRTLSWHASALGRQRAQVSFVGYAEPGFPPGKVAIQSQLTGVTSGQTWQANLDIWLNQYGISLPFTRR